MQVKKDNLRVWEAKLEIFALFIKEASYGGQKKEKKLNTKLTSEIGSVNKP
jgi:hypothetical protein